MELIRILLKQSNRNMVDRCVETLPVCADTHLWKQWRLGVKDNTLASCVIVRFCITVVNTTKIICRKKKKQDQGEKKCQAFLQTDVSIFAWLMLRGVTEGW